MESQTNNTTETVTTRMHQQGRTPREKEARTKTNGDHQQPIREALEVKTEETKNRWDSRQLYSTSERSKHNTLRRGLVANRQQSSKNSKRSKPTDSQGNKERRFFCNHSDRQKSDQKLTDAARSTQPFSQFIKRQHSIQDIKTEETQTDDLSNIFALVNHGMILRSRKQSTGKTCSTAAQLQHIQDNSLQRKTAFFGLVVVSSR